MAKQRTDVSADDALILVYTTVLVFALMFLGMALA